MNNCIETILTLPKINHISLKCWQNKNVWCLLVICKNELMNTLNFTLSKYLKLNLIRAQFNLIAISNPVHLKLFLNSNRYLKFTGKQRKFFNNLQFIQVLKNGHSLVHSLTHPIIHAQKLNRKSWILLNI